MVSGVLTGLEALLADEALPSQRVPALSLQTGASIASAALPALLLAAGGRIPPSEGAWFDVWQEMIRIADAGTNFAKRRMCRARENVNTATDEPARTYAHTATGELCGLELRGLERLRSI